MVPGRHSGYKPPPMGHGTASKLGRVIAVTVTIIAGVGLAIWLSLPALVRLAIQREAEARGFGLEIGDVRVSAAGLELRNVRFEREDPWVRGTAGRVGVEGRLLDLVRHRAAGIRMAHVDDVEVDVLLRRREGASDADDSASPSVVRTLPPLVARRVTVWVMDPRGELARARVDRVVLDGDEVVVDVDSASLGGLRALATLSRARVEASTSSRRISKVEIESLDLAGLASEDDVEAFVARARSLRGRVDSADVPPEDEAMFARYARVLDRLSEDFELRVVRGALPRRSGAEAFILENFGVERSEASSVRIHGRGRGPASASAVFDVGFDALALRANGKIVVQNLALDAIAGLVPRIPWHEPERGMMDADMRFDAASPDVIDFSGTFAMRGLGIDSPRIASEPIVDLDFSVSAAGSWGVETRRLVVERGSFTLGSATVDFDGAAVLDPDAWSLSLRARLPRTDCDQAVHAFPAAILGDASAFLFRGTLGGELRLRADAQALDGLELEIRVDDECRFVDWPPHADPARFRSLFVHEALDPAREPFDFETGPRSEVWTSLEEVSPYLVAAVLAHEDASFFRHKGFSTFAIRESLARNIAAGRFERGASTLTMQLAKNLFLNREKVLVRKLREVIYTWWLEKGFGKESTLELYLNVVEFGPFIYGVRNASLHYFGREPAALSPAEATFLAVILPSPRSGAFHYERGELSRSAKGRMASLLKNMERRGMLSSEAAEYGLSEIESFRFHPAGAAPPPPRTLPPTHPLFELESPLRTNDSMGEDEFDPWETP
jgi:hypothetical protein